jgi:transcriptional regulator with XRE-family HTH domain
MCLIIHTHFWSTEMAEKYESFGKLLIQLRLQTGLSQQSELASLLKTSQQTVSRWEQGLSRPRDKQLPLLGKILKTDPAILLTAAGYDHKQVAATFDQPFPLEALNPDSFERFCLYFLSHLYPKARVHRAGTQGHTQDGVDIDAIFPKETVYSFQCKRVGTFGPEKVKAVVAAHTRPAKNKFLLLTRVASPQARQAISSFSEWDIWDKEDVSRIIRQDLTLDQQIKLIDIFFNGQRLALLGVTEAGPWQDSEQFFAAFLQDQKAFSHNWQLIGRETELTIILNGLLNPHVRCQFLIGTGGAGKSRLLKQVIEDFQQVKGKSVLVRFLSPTEEITNKSLEHLGRGEKLLIVDDAHDRKDLQLLFQYASVESNQAKILLSFRPYGLSFIEAQASNFALSGDNVLKTKLTPLNLPQTTQLAAQVLQKLDGPAELAGDIARLTIDCPLATVMGAHVVTKHSSPIEFVKNEEVFRTTLLGKFQDTIAGEIGNKSDSESVKKLLKIVALIQPFHPDDSSIIHLAEKIENISSSDTHRIIRLLCDAGVLFKRGGLLRISPDLLGDYIIENSCIAVNGKSTGYAESVFDIANNTHVEHVLLNLGKLDWRLANGNPTNSKLLDGIWNKLEPASDYSDPHITAVTSVAYYQPNRALDFAEHLIREGKYLRDLPNLIKYTAYNIEYTLRACECLWELGRSDSRQLHQHPGHAIRLLVELCAIEPNKPIEYSEIVVNFALELLDNNDSFDGAYTPFDVLEGILKTEGHTTRSNKASVVFEPYFVPISFVSALRNKVIDKAIGLLSGNNARVSVHAARFLHNGLRYPMGMFNTTVSSELRSKWTDEFVKILEKIEIATQSKDINPLVLIELVKSISWHAHYAEGITSEIANRVIDTLPNTLEFRTTLTLIDGYGHLFEHRNYEKHQQDWQEYLSKLTSELITKFSDGEKLRAFIEDALLNIEKNHIKENRHPYALYWNLIQASPTLAKATIQIALLFPESKTNRHVDISLSKILSEEYTTGVELAKELLKSNVVSLQAAVAGAYGGISKKDGEYTEDDIQILKQLLSSKDQWIIQRAIHAIRGVAANNKLLAIELLKYIDISISNKIADEVFMLFPGEDQIPFKSLKPADIDHFLEKLFQVPELDGYWIETFLANASQYHPIKTAAFFMARVLHAVQIESWKFRPCNFGPYINVPLRFKESDSFSQLLNEVSQWMRVNQSQGFQFLHFAGELFNAMFGPHDAEILGFIYDWIDSGNSSDFKIISQILSEANPSFIFEQKAFVVRFLEKAKLYGKNTLEEAQSGLYRSAISGVRTGTPGEPFPKDIFMRDESEKILSELSRFSPAYSLYESIKKHAEDDIRISLREREAYEDE